MNRQLASISSYTSFLAGGDTVEETERKEGTETGSQTAMVKVAAQETTSSAHASHCSCS